MVVVGRSESKTKAVAAELGADYFVVDFADLTQVGGRRQIRSEYSRTDVLANNAGGMCRKVEFTADGYEKTYQVNYLAPFLLTTHLLDVLVESRAAVVSTTSSSQRLLARVAIAGLENTTQPPRRRLRADEAGNRPVHPGTATADEGADQLVWLASSAPGIDWAAGEYYSKGRVAKANRAELARELWERTTARLS